MCAWRDDDRTRDIKGWVGRRTHAERQRGGELVSTYHAHERGAATTRAAARQERAEDADGGRRGEAERLTTSTDRLLCCGVSLWDFVGWPTGLLKVAPSARHRAMSSWPTISRPSFCLLACCWYVLLLACIDRIDVVSILLMVVSILLM